VERRLAAILCADVYGYSRLMRQDGERVLLKHRIASLPIAEVRYDDLLDFQAHLQTITGGHRSNMVMTLLKTVFKTAARSRDIPPGDNSCRVNTAHAAFGDPRRDARTLRVHFLSGRLSPSRNDLRTIPACSSRAQTG